MWAGNTKLRRAVKQVLAPLKDTELYRQIQATVMARDIRRKKFYDYEIELLPLAIRPGENVVDIGANFGMYIHHLSEAVGPSGKIYAYEPIPFTFGVLRKVVGKLGVTNAILINKGLSDQAGTVTFSAPLQASGQISAGVVHLGTRNDDHPGKDTQVRWQATTPIKAEVTTMDETLKDVDRLSFIKADIEGAEVLAFRGAQHVIDTHLPTVLTEINPWYLEGFGFGVADLTGPFRRRGYHIFSWDHETRKLREVRDEDIVEANYLLIHPKYMDRFASVMQSA